MTAVFCLTFQQEEKTDGKLLALSCTEHHCTEQHWTSLHGTALNCASLDWTSLHYMTVSFCDEVWKGDTLTPKLSPIWLKPLFLAASHQDRRQFFHLKGMGWYACTPATSSFCEDFLSWGERYFFCQYRRTIEYKTIQHRRPLNICKAAKDKKQIWIL